mmetsp:Transcript_12000/g.39493  ORF Transcript_12000/g.39493 Transcript_12000/m.39493 type:complete len:210 (+) Transcript_12000:189-818(+)
MRTWRRSTSSSTRMRLSRSSPQRRTDARPVPARNRFAHAPAPRNRRRRRNVVMCLRKLCTASAALCKPPRRKPSPLRSASRSGTTRAASGSSPFLRWRRRSPPSPARGSRCSRRSDSCSGSSERSPRQVSPSVPCAGAPWQRRANSLSAPSPYSCPPSTRDEKTPPRVPLGDFWSGHRRREVQDPRSRTSLSWDLSCGSSLAPDPTGVP